jgi:GH15 family glucan-1,4-alpha-glucosidase
LPSWNLWEDRRGIHTFTCATVVAGLRAAANFAALFAEYEKASEYRTAADDMVAGMRKHLYSEQLGRFLRSLQSNGESLEPDATVDASLFAVFYFGCFDADDPLVTSSMDAVKEQLSNDLGVGRFNHDGYMRVSDKITGNTWFICTLWYADYLVAKAKDRGELVQAMDVIRWVVDKALPSGVLAEQLDPLSGAHISVSPLTWSHSTFVATVLGYLKKYRSLSQ